MYTQELAIYQPLVLQQDRKHNVNDPADADARQYYEVGMVGCRLRLFSSNRTTYCSNQSIVGGRYPVLTCGTDSARDSEHFEG